jgi:nitronate monooxygenase
MRRALAAFPAPELAATILARYYIPGGKGRREAFTAAPMPSASPSAERQTLVMVANFVEVYLAREGHGNPVGINYLEKIQTPHLTGVGRFLRPDATAYSAADVIAVLTASP